MAKIYIEAPEELKEKFIIECAKRGVTQRSVITYLVEMWLRKGKKK